MCLTTSLYQLRGAAWFDCIGCAMNTNKRSVEIPAHLLRGGEGNCSQTVEPDMLTLENGHSFNIGPSTPASVTQALYDLALSEAAIHDVPEELLAYRMKPEEE